MKGLVQMRLGNKDKLPLAKNMKRPATSFRERNSVYINYKLNGYWFHLSQQMWSRWFSIPACTISSRIKAGKTPGQVLGFEHIKRGNPGYEIS